MIVPLQELLRLSDIAKERYMTKERDIAFPFSYAIPISDIGSTDMKYQEVLVDYRHDVGVYIELRKEQE